MNTIYLLTITLVLLTTHGSCGAIAESRESNSNLPEVTDNGSATNAPTAIQFKDKGKRKVAQKKPQTQHEMPNTTAKPEDEVLMKNTPSKAKDRTASNPSKSAVPKNPQGKVVTKYPKNIVSKRKHNCDEVENSEIESQLKLAAPSDSISGLPEGSPKSTLPKAKSVQSQTQAAKQKSTPKINISNKIVSTSTPDPNRRAHVIPQKQMTKSNDEIAPNFLSTSTLKSKVKGPNQIVSKSTKKPNGKATIKGQQPTTTQIEKTLTTIPDGKDDMNMKLSKPTFHPMHSLAKNIAITTHKPQGKPHPTVKHIKPKGRAMSGRSDTKPVRIEETSNPTMPNPIGNLVQNHLMTHSTKPTKKSTYNGLHNSTQRPNEKGMKKNTPKSTTNPLWKATPNPKENASEKIQSKPSTKPNSQKATTVKKPPKRATDTFNPNFGLTTTPVPKVEDRNKILPQPTRKPKGKSDKDKVVHKPSKKPSGKSASTLMLITTPNPNEMASVQEMLSKSTVKPKGAGKAVKKKNDVVLLTHTSERPTAEPLGKKAPLNDLTSKDRLQSDIQNWSTAQKKDLTESGARKFVVEIEPLLSDKCYKRAHFAWEFVTNLTAENEKRSLDADFEFTEFHRNVFWDQLMEFPWKGFKDPTLRRQFYLESVLGLGILPIEKRKKHSALTTGMTKIYSTGKVCDFRDKKKCDITLDPSITSIMAYNRDPEELKHYWVEWRNATGKKMRTMFKEYVKLSNEAAKLNGFRDMGHMWRRSYEPSMIQMEMWALWGQLKPLYEQLHAYTRRKLSQHYGTDLVPLDGTISAHLLGNMWAQSWGNIYADLLHPFEGGKVAQMNVTGAMLAQNYSVIQMVQKSDQFFQSLGLLPMNEEFWNGSIFERPPPPRQMVCHPEAYDSCDKQHFFIKMCATVDMGDFITIHHEMGHIQYYMQYKDQLNTFREGANTGFHEAIGDTIALSVASPGHLMSIGLLPDYEDTTPNRISFLMNQALRALVDIPWALTLEQWRWDMFSGIVAPDEYNCHWWALRNRIQGLRPPQTRSWEDFDPGAKYHVPNDTPYERYFVARILTYQFHEALCIEAGQYERGGSKPLHLCSIHGSKKAGTKLGDMVRLGSSVPWPEALKKVTGSSKLDATPTLNYFASLMEWLKEENKRNNEEIGWHDDDPDALCTNKQ